MLRDSAMRSGAFSPPSLCTSIVWAAPSLSRMRLATPNGVSLTGASPPIRRSAQESEGEESKTGAQISVDHDQPAHGRVRYAAQNRHALDGWWDLAHEMEALRPLPGRRFDSAKRVRVRVNSGSLYHRRGHSYPVSAVILLPSSCRTILGLIREKLLVPCFHGPTSRPKLGFATQATRPRPQRGLNRLIEPV
jgi:hypothetical protein